MTDYADRIRKYNRAGQVQHEWWEEVADYIDELENKVKALEYAAKAGTYHDGFRDGKLSMKDCMDELEELRWRLGELYD